MSVVAGTRMCSVTCVTHPGVGRTLFTTMPCNGPSLMWNPCAQVRVQCSHTRLGAAVADYPHKVSFGCHRTIHSAYKALDSSPVVISHTLQNLVYCARVWRKMGCSGRPRPRAHTPCTSLPRLGKQVLETLHSRVKRAPRHFILVDHSAGWRCHSAGASGASQY